MADQLKKLPRLYPGWKDQPELFERYWDEAMQLIEDLQNKIKLLDAAVFP